MEESLDKTSLGALQPGSRVNLERAVTVAAGSAVTSSRATSTAPARSSRREPGEHWEVVTIELPADLARYVVMKGSITVDGVSLTVSDLVDGARADVQRQPDPDHARADHPRLQAARRPRQPRGRRARQVRRTAHRQPRRTPDGSAELSARPTTWVISGHEILVREVVGNGFGLASAILGMRRITWAWPVGMIGNALLFTVFIGGIFDKPQEHDLWGQAARQVFFFAVSAYGWWRWRRSEQRRVAPPTAARSPRAGRPRPSCAG